jgi:hypothetical protein
VLRIIMMPMPEEFLTSTSIANSRAFTAPRGYAPVPMHWGFVSVRVDVIVAADPIFASHISFHARISSTTEPHQPRHSARFVNTPQFGTITELVRCDRNCRTGPFRHRWLYCTSTGSMSSPGQRLSEGPLPFGKWRQSSSAAFSCNNIGLLAAPSAIDYKQHVRLALKVSTPDESCDLDQDFPAAFVADRIIGTSPTHALPSPYVLLSMTASLPYSVRTQCNLISALGRI